MRSSAPYLYILAFYGALAAGFLLTGEQRRSKMETQNTSPPRLPKITIVLFLIVAVPTVLQFFFPALLTALERDRSRILAGEFWRLATSLLVQDGGIQGSVFNLVSLLLLGSVAER